jgi:hypothetical protein
VRLDEVIEVGGPDFFLAFENDLHVDGESAVLFQVCLDGLEVHEHLTLVVGSAARVDLAVADRCLERRRFPQIHRVDRLDVVVAVKKDRRCAGRAEPIAVDNREPRRLDQLHVLQADSPHFVGRPLGAALDVSSMLRQRADAGNGKIRLQLLDVAIPMCVDEIDDVVHGASSDEESQVRDAGAGCSMGRFSRSPHSFHEPIYIRTRGYPSSLSARYEFAAR